MTTLISAGVAAATVALASAGTLHAQRGQFAFPDPPPGRVTVSSDVVYGHADTVQLRMDVYRPAGNARARPGLILFKGTPARGAPRDDPLYSGWARTAASMGVVAIIPDLYLPQASHDFQMLLAHLTQHAREYGIDSEAIAVHAVSSNVLTVFPLVEDSTQYAVKAAIMYYGSAPITRFRRDLPVLLVRAGLDHANTCTPVCGPTAGLAALATAAAAQNAPVTFVNHSIGHHTFELVDNNDATRAVIEETIAFVKQATSAPYQAALRRGLPEATAEAHVVGREFHTAAAEYAELVKRYPADAALRLSYGEALLGDEQFAAACTALAPLKGSGLGALDLGLPAARACAQQGDADAAMEWLRTIPRSYFPPGVANDPAFATLRDRADFRALFDSLPSGTAHGDP